MTTTLTERAQSFGHLFVDRVAKTPNGEAFRYRAGDDWVSLTWAQTKERVFTIAAGLVDLGVEPQQRVAIAATTRIEWILSDLAILCAGAVAEGLAVRCPGGPIHEEVPERLGSFG